MGGREFSLLGVAMYITNNAEEHISSVISSTIVYLSTLRRRNLEIASFQR